MTKSPESFPIDAVNFAVGRSRESDPYLFAFGGRAGSVTIWSIQSNQILRWCDEAQLFEVIDLATVMHPLISVGRRLTIPPPHVPEEGRNDQEEEDESGMTLG